jgi:hypothetical protein
VALMPLFQGSALLWIAIAGAEVPLPVFPDCAEDDLSACPTDLEEAAWDLTSWVPESSKASVRPEELATGSGISADVAFRRSTGRFDVPVAVIDSGVEWQNANLTGKFRVNVAELPLPQDASDQTADTYDLDGNGVVNVRAWSWDARVDITVGVDAADGYSDHGTGVMEEAAAEGGDGSGIGVCPNCAVIPVRVGDVFLSDGDRVGLAIAFATDSGARSIALAIGALSDSDLTRAAIAYADAEGVVLVAAAGDENSWHHNFPAVHDPILYVHSVRGDNSNEDGGVYSFLNFFNCNNFGPRLDLVAPSSACATGATAKVAGAAALVLSAGIDAGLELDADEVRALLRGTVDEVGLPEVDRAEADTYPSHEGWDPFYGYGRLNLGAAVEQVFAGDVPPVARIDSPEWFAFTSGEVAVSGRIAARDGVASWSLDVGRGLDPDDPTSGSGWTPLVSGTEAVDGEIARVSVPAYSGSFGDLGAEDLAGRSERAHLPMVTLRLTVEDAAGRRSVARRGFWSYTDPALLPGFPIELGASGAATPQLADLDGDVGYEIVVAGSDGRVHAYDVSGAGVTELPGFPVRTGALAGLAGGWDASPAYATGGVPGDVTEGVLATPAVGDVDGDGAPEIVVGSLRGGVYAWHADGSAVAGFPVRLVGRLPEEFTAGRSWDDGVVAAPSLGDVDGDGVLDVVVAGMDQRLYAWDGAGALFDGYPLEVCIPEGCGGVGARIISSPALGDIDADGDLDAAFGTNELPAGAAGVVFVVDLIEARIWDGYPLERDGLINQVVLPVIGEGHPSSVALADIDGDGDLEIASNPMLGTEALLDHDGTDALSIGYLQDGFGPGSNYDEGALITMATNPAFGDMDGDGGPDFLTGGASATFLVSLALATDTPYHQGIGGWNGRTGVSLAGFPRQVDDVSFLQAPTIADVSGDGVPEAIYGSAGHFVYAWDANGVSAEGWPRFTGGWMLGGTAIGDVDGDGWLDVATTTREGYLFVWRTEGRADQVLEWAGPFHDPANSGNYETPLPSQPGPVLVDGGCCKEKQDAADAVLVVLLLPVVLRRRVFRT